MTVHAPSSRTRAAIAAIALAAGLAVGLAPAAAAASPAPAGGQVVPAVSLAGNGASVDTRSAAADAGAARRARADATRAERSARAQERLDARAALAPREVVEWGVDPATEQVVVRVTGAQVTPAAAAFAADPDVAAVRVETGAAPAQPLSGTALVGGQAIYGGGKRCSLGFSVRQGSTAEVLTAGHCAQSTPSWNGVDRTALGTVAKAAYPDDDYGMITVRTPANWTMTNQVQGGPAVTGARVAAVGAQVCRSGSTTGYRCGKILSRNVSVNYGNGVIVKGMTKTSACAEGGDSGGSVVEPATRQAQGLVSGGSGTCANGGVSYFQPLAEVLSALRLTLVTA